MSKYKVVLIPGDGVGPELTEAMRRCIDSLGLGIEWEIMEACECAIEKYKTPLPEHVLEAIKKTGFEIK